jgi:opacity protein-like surface antigen
MLTRIAGGIALFISAVLACGAANAQPYVGAHLGPGTANFKIFPNEPSNGDRIAYSGNGWTAGLFAGVRLGAGGRLSLSPEIEASAGRIRARTTGASNFLDVQEVGRSLGMTLRLSYRVRPYTELFGGVGLSQAKLESSRGSDTVSLRFATSATSTGKSLLGGVQFGLSPKTFLRGEYVMTKYSDTKWGTPDQAYHMSTSTEVVRVAFGRTF